MAFRVSRGTGMAGQREGLLFRNVLATYTHLHALGCPQWAKALVRRAREYHADTDLEANASPPGAQDAGADAPVARG
jgi:CobQ-like glutamine amidotransferase family enzyme